MEKRIQTYVHEHFSEIMEDLMGLVQHQGATSEIENLNKVRAYLKSLIEKRLCEEVFEIEVNSGRNVLTTVHENERSIVLMGHYDTVHPAGKLPVILEEKSFRGPGVLDMKAGLVMGIWAVKALKDLKLNCSYPVSLLYNGDEEIGSRDSKEVLIEKVKDAECVFILEPGVENGDVKTGRKGAMACDIVIHGKASHAGNHPEEGVNAILEMSHHIIALQNLNHNTFGTTVNVGKISGGTVSNVVPDRAEITVDLRYKTIAEKERIQHEIMAIPLLDKKTSKEVTFSEGSNPLEQNDKNIHLYELAKQCAQKLGFDLNHQFVGGASDGNRISHLGIAILDGMGAVGKGIHALDEQIDLASYQQRISLLISVLHAYQ